MSDVAVIGAGAWGTALALVAHRAGRSVTLWARDPGRAGEIAAARSNPRLPGVVLPPEIDVTGILPDAGLMLLVTPLQHLRGIVQRLPNAGTLVVCAKGVEAHTLRLPLEILADLRPKAASAVLTGPNFAHEIAAGLPAAAVVASHDAAVRQAVISALATPDYRLYGNDDPVGAQIGGAAKNVIAIAAGAAIGAGLGENARAALITRGLAELTRLAEALGGRGATIAGLSGLGDLLLTCTGASSRNSSLGFALGQGATLAEVLARRSSVAEGVATAPAVVARAVSAGVSLPICAAVADLVTGRSTLQNAMSALLSRPLRDE